MSTTSNRSGISDLQLESKVGLGVRHISEDILARSDGGQLPPISKFASDLHLGTGTIQSAFSYLRDVGACEYVSRGHLGTTLLQRDVAKLWMLARDRSVDGLLPMPYSRVYEGLSTGVREVFRRSKLGVAFSHSNGSRSRIEGLVRGDADFAIASQLSYDLAQEEGLAVALGVDVGRGSFVREHVVLSRPGEPSVPSPGMTVGVDPASLDQPFIMSLLCGETKVKFSEVRYFDFEDRLIRGDVILIESSPLQTMRSISPRISRSSKSK